MNNSFKWVNESQTKEDLAVSNTLIWVSLVCNTFTFLSCGYILINLILAICRIKSFAEHRKLRLYKLSAALVTCITLMIMLQTMVPLWP